MMHKAILIAVTASFIGLAACAHAPEPKLIVKEVRVPVSQPCVPPDVPQPPARYADDGITASTPPDQVVLKLATANMERKRRLIEIEPIVSACRR